MIMLKTPVILIAALLSATAASAERYVAISTTAMSITGDIELDDTGITFQNGETLGFDGVVADTFTVSGEAVDATVYGIAEPANPELENGNTLCGDDPVTFIAVWHGDEDLTRMAMFNGETAPESDEAMCASFLYEAAAQ